MENLYFKLTTLPQTEDVSGKELELYFKKYQETNNLEDLNQAKEDYYLNAGKNPLFGKIYSITVGCIYNGDVRITVLKGDEKNIIQEFINICNNKNFEKHQIAGWNFSFLLPFLRIRAKKNKIHQTLHKDCQDLNKKPWTITGLDLFDAWKGLGWFQSSLEEVAELTFDLPTNFIDGKDVYNYWKEGKDSILDISSADEIMTLINVHKGIKGEEFIDNKVISVQVLEEVKAVELPLLQKIFAQKQITEEVKEQLKQTLSKSKITKKEKETLFKIIRGVYVETDFENKNQDSKATIERKEKEIKELLKL